MSFSKTRQAATDLISLLVASSISIRIGTDPARNKTSPHTGTMKTIVLLATLLLIPSIGYARHELLNRDLNNGQQLYAEHCGSCHGVNLEGEPNWQTMGEDGIMPAPPHDETGHTWHHDNRLLFNYTKFGGLALFESMGITDIKSGMPGFGQVLKDDDIWDVLGYIRSSWTARVQKIQDSRNQPHQ